MPSTCRDWMTSVIRHRTSALSSSRTVTTLPDLKYMVSSLRGPLTGTVLPSIDKPPAFRRGVVGLQGIEPRYLRCRRSALPLSYRPECAHVRSLPTGTSSFHPLGSTNRVRRFATRLSLVRLCAAPPERIKLSFPGLERLDPIHRRGYKWSGRRDLHPLGQESQSCCSTTLHSPGVGPQGFEPCQRR